MSMTGNPYSSINGMTSSSIKSLFVAEGEKLLKGAKLCEELWEEMRKADFRKEGVLNETNIQLIYENKSKIITTLLRIASVEEFIAVFDDDEDGFLNEDEQIMVFTLIAQRIQIIAEELCSLKKYELYKDLMKQVRAIETQINKYQNELRINVHKKQLDDYISIGKEMQNEFDENWNKKIENFETKAVKAIQSHEQALKQEIDTYYQIEAAKINSCMKLKPNHHLQLLANQERLVASNERVEEAVNFRNELHKLQKKDEERLNRAKKEMLRNLNQKINTNEQKQMKKINEKFRKERNKLIIARNKETDILSKQINLHINDIIRIQNSLSNMYLNIGSKEAELNRLKQRKQKTNETIAQFKSLKGRSMSSPSLGSNVGSQTPQYSTSITKRDIALALINLQGKSLNLNTSIESSRMNKFGSQRKNITVLKYMMKHLKLTRFSVSLAGTKKFCNISKEQTAKGEDNNNLKRKIKTLLEQRHFKDEILIPPSAYYDAELKHELDTKKYRELLPKIQ